MREEGERQRVREEDERQKKGFQAAPSDSVSLLLLTARFILVVL